MPPEARASAQRRQNRNTGILAEEPEGVTPSPGSRFEELAPEPAPQAASGPSAAEIRARVTQILQPIPAPIEPSGIGGEIGGGGELELPPVIVDEPERIESDSTSEEEIVGRSVRPRSRIVPGGEVRDRGSQATEAEGERLSQLGSGADPAELERLRTLSSEQASIGSLESGSPRYSFASAGTTSTTREVEGGGEVRVRDRGDQVSPAEALRLSRLALEEAAVVEEQEEQEEEQERLRLVDTQDFLSGFDRPTSPSLGRSGQVAAGTSSAEEAILQATPDSRIVPVPDERVIAPEGIQFSLTQQERPIRPLDPDVLFEELAEADVVGEVQNQAPQRVRDSSQLYNSTFDELSGQIRAGPRAVTGSKGGLGFRVRNNTDRTLKKVEPGDVVDIIGVETGSDGRGTYRLNTQKKGGTRVKLDQLGPLVDDGSFLFERGHRYELGGHFDRETHGPPPREPEPEPAEQEPGLLQQGAEAAGGAAAGVVGGAGRLAGGLALGAAQGLYEQLPSAGDVGGALGRGAVAGVAGVARLAGGAVAGALGGGEEEEVDLDEP